MSNEIKIELKDIEETGLNDFKTEDFELMYPNADYSKLDYSIDKVLSINKILKKVVYYDDGVRTIYPEHFYLRYDGKTIIEW